MNRQVNAGTTTDVLIVGGSLVGLSTALFLAHHGVRTCNVERHSGTAIHPRAGHFHLRTLEALRSAGVENAVKAASLEQFPPDGGIAAVESLAGREIARYIDNLNKGVGEFSPSTRLFLTQQRLEPLLREHAEAAGARMDYDTELLSYTQDDEGVTAEVRALPDGATRTIRAKYMVAADGNRSPVREGLGIGMQGPGWLSNSMTIYFRAPVCRQLMAGRNLGVTYVFNDQIRGFLRFEKDNDAGFLVVMSLGDASRAGALNASADIGADQCRTLVRSAIGVDDALVDILDVAPWFAVASVAEKFQEGRVFLIGDAAHIVPPTGGFGGNTGIQDAHNLAWKIAMVLNGQAGPALLATYDAERQPVGAATVEQAYTRYVKRIAPHLDGPQVPPLMDDLSTEIGHHYRSTAIVAEPEDADRAVFQHPHKAGGRPGSRAPHVVVSKGGQPLSLLDLYGKSPVLLTGAGGGIWRALASQLAKQAGIEVAKVTVGTSASADVNDTSGEFESAYGIGDTGATLVRPDGVVAWRSRAADDSAPRALGSAFAAITGRH